MQRLTALFSAAFLLITSSANADLIINSRSSLLSTNIDFGYIGNVTTSTDALSYSAIDDVQLVRQGNATDGGALGDISWDATYQYGLEQQLDPGTPQGFGGSGSVSLFTFIGGDGVSYLASTNRLAVEFQNTAAGVFEVTFNGTPLSNIGLERMTSPGNWEPIYSQTGGFEIFVATLPLDAGNFRLTAEAFVNTDNGGSNNSTFSFSVAAVPEPSSMLLAGCAAAFLLAKLRRRS